MNNFYFWLQSISKCCQYRELGPFFNMSIHQIFWWEIPMWLGTISRRTWIPKRGRIPTFLVTSGLKAMRQKGELIQSSNFRIDFTMIYNIITVRASFVSFQNRREIKTSNSQLIYIIYQICWWFKKGTTSYLWPLQNQKIFVIVNDK